MPTTKRRRRAVLGILFVCIAAGISVAMVMGGEQALRPTAPTVAHTFTVAGGSFQAAFPGQVIISRAPARLDGVGYVSTGYMDFAGSEIFATTVYPFPLGKPSMGAIRFLRIFTWHVAASGRYTIPGATPTSFHGLPALSALFAAPGGRAYTKVLAVLDGHVAYFIEVSGSSRTPAGYDSFVASFRPLPG